MKDPDKLLFIHIPKTGGMSIRSMLNATLFDLDFGNRHLSAVGYCSKISRELFDKLYKFTVVRNPYDRLVSYYYFMQTDDSHPMHIELRELTLSEYIERACNFAVYTQFKQVEIEGRIVVDRILRFENLDEDWKQLATEFGLPEFLPKVNTSAHCNWQEELSISDMGAVYKSFEVDFKMFGYNK